MELSWKFIPYCQFLCRKLSGGGGGVSKSLSFLALDIVCYDTNLPPLHAVERFLLL